MYVGVKFGKGREGEGKGRERGKRREGKRKGGREGKKIAKLTCTNSQQLINLLNIQTQGKTSWV